MKTLSILKFLFVQSLYSGTLARVPWSSTTSVATKVASLPGAKSPSTSAVQPWGTTSPTLKKSPPSPSQETHHDETDKKMRIEVIEPGLVVIRNFLSEKEQQRVAQQAQAMGEQDGEDGFYTKDTDGNVILNTGEQRGRIYDAAAKFPKAVTDYCAEAVKLARGIDNNMPHMQCTHVLLNMYTSNEGLVWHRDIYENDGTADHPIVNLCVGASCVFGFQHNDDDPVRTVTLRSGDVILFGGPCRLIKHSVMEVLLEDSPDWMEVPCRYSFTYRDSPEVIGREDEFKYFRVSDHLVGQDTFKPPSNPKQFKGLPDLETQHAGTPFSVHV